MNTWNLLILCSTAVLLGLLWAAVLLAAADKASKAMRTPQASCNCAIRGKGPKVSGTGTAADPLGRD